VSKHEDIFDSSPAPDPKTPERGSESQTGGASGVAFWLAPFKNAID